MRRGGIEVVPRSVKICRHQVDRVKAILLPVSLGLNEQRLFSDSVRRIGLFRIPIPQLGLLEWDRSDFRVRANGAYKHEFLEAEHAALLDNLRTHHQVRVEKIAGMLLVRADSANSSCEMDQ